ncbi:MAG: aspartate carbamoyltransferase [Oscillospiraceae bacterium]|nr:aspartate carbamoyltransferase [Oscillospiraceae bacterium]MBQ5313003.1 aspartate carbamoyltransferase [Oscillospiraceae bacterium]
MRHLIDPLYFSVKETEALLDVADDICENREKYAHKCDGRILATLFFEPSTRTRLSFESAMMRLGGKVLGFSSASSSSAAKGESVGDTVSVISYYADIIAMRHPKDGAAFRASQYTKIPIINAGDGGHHHPTQTLTDLMTIRRRHGRLDNLTVGFCGDLKYGRTVHSLVKALSRYKGNHFVFISPEELKVPGYIIEEYLKNSECTFEEVTDLSAAMPALDILYMTRIQRERFEDIEEYERLKNSYILTPDHLVTAKKDMAVLHPLPRVNEITLAVDDDERAKYFEQAGNGVYVRMALILSLLGMTDFDTDKVEEHHDEVVELDHVCKNGRCITNAEEETMPIYVKGENGKVRCKFCDQYVDLTEC